MRIAIVGAGRIGSELHKKTELLGWTTKAVLKDDGIYKDMSEKIDKLENHKDHLKDIDVAFLAIPTLDDGKTAFDYIRLLLDRRIPVVTCEKGALSNYFSDLKSSLNRIGYSATVGGGTRMLRYIEDMASSEVEELHVIPNGTLNFIFSEVSRGRSLGEVVEETKRLGYSEPGANDPLEIINKESTQDVPMKTAILFNICRFSPECTRAKDMNPHKIKEPELDRLVKESMNRRYIVSFMRKKSKEDVIGGFSCQIGDWSISAGFKNINENPRFSQLVSSGVDNAILIYEGKYGIDGTYRLIGPGAGSGPTTASMIKDANRLLQK